VEEPLSTLEVLVTSSPDGKDGTDDVRRKFREALERKNQRTHATAESARQDGSDKSHGAATPTKGPNYRRKTG
jgi:Family of unknown function (DUF5302)